MDGVRDLEAFHAVSVSPFLKVHFKGSSPPIAKVTAYFTLILDSKAMKLIQPVRYRFSIPSKR